MKFYILVLLILGTLSCHTSKELTTKFPCEFNDESNSIIGEDIDAKEFYRPTYYIQ